jgi:hypothetical protein
VSALRLLSVLLLQVADPLRHFVDGLLSLTNPIGNVLDKVNVGLFRCVCALHMQQDSFGSYVAGAGLGIDGHQLCCIVVSGAGSCDKSLW